jgi:hypothetical protein
MTDLDFFDAAPSDQDLYEVRGGRYRFPPPPGYQPNPRGWMRMSNLAGAFSDQRALQLWLERMTLLGLLANEGLIFDELAALPDDALDRDTLAEVAERARTAAGGDKGARKGTARHLMMEGYLNTGEINGHRRMRLQMDDLLREMDAQGLEFLPGWSERKVWHPIAGGTMGTLDTRVLCRHTGQIGVFDLKTQKRFWTYQESAGQQWGYSTAHWVWEGPESAAGRWVPYVDDAGPNTLLGRPGGVAEGRPVALLAHMPSEGGPVQIHEVDIGYGGAVMTLAAAVVELRSIGKSVAAGRAVGGQRPLPVGKNLDVRA